jgi:hypothetical protein
VLLSPLLSAFVILFVWLSKHVSQLEILDVMEDDQIKEGKWSHVAVCMAEMREIHALIQLESRGKR